MEDDPNLILILRGRKESDTQVLLLPHNTERYIVTRSKSAPTYNEYFESLHLTFNKPPTDITRGFLFGTDKKRCDVLLSERESPHLSGVHFCITFDVEGRLVLRDVSTKQTAVSHDGLEAEHWRRGFTWVLSLDRVTPCIHLLNGISLEIKIPTHNSRRCQEQYQENVKAYLEASNDQSLALGGLNVLSRDPTQPHTPILDPIYLPIKAIGSGSYGTVSKVINVSNGLTYASKRPSNLFGLDAADSVRITLGSDAEKQNKQTEEAFKMEIQIMKTILHKHIVKFVGYTLHPLQLIMEYMPLKNLRYQNEKSRVTFAETQLVLAQGLDALLYLHSSQITHRDIKPENILVQDRGESFHIRLGDFGFSKTGAWLTSGVGSPYYQAPEFIGCAPYDNKVDIWALGVVVLEYSYGIPRRHSEAHLTTIASTAQEAANTYPHSHFYSLVSRMLEMKPSDRASVSDLFAGKPTIDFTADFSSEYVGDASGSSTPTNRGPHEQSGTASASPDRGNQISAADLQSLIERRRKLSTNSDGRPHKRNKNLADGGDSAQLQSDKTVKHAPRKKSSI
ncbi:serine/threonine protein kinase [Emergomyces africanus]|uniref:Serine/threonine protein kinase n=1 Tax=Emergomyces africanus TaxID=1955775 RepID=A0A1B7NVU1_9EURO|nr:serine/threonine protein kinase [Emergomyces africanus]